MSLALLILAGLSIIELLLWFGFSSKQHKTIASALILSESLAMGLLFGGSLDVFTGLIVFSGVYRVINLLRLIEGRSEPDYLIKVFRRTSLRLIATQIVLVGLWLVSRHFKLKPSLLMIILGVFELAAAITLLVSNNRHIRTTRIAKHSENHASRDLPSLSILIPARNETVDLEECLTSLVASSYPKLEIIVLDDCSQDKHTPEIIKGFAQSGVRFIAGKIPPDNWLAKNYAYDELSRQASGEIVLFCGVDTRFQVDSLSIMVESLIEKKKVMASVMPINKYPESLNDTLIQPSRYAWELALPRRLFNRPPVLSTCWLIYKEKLSSYGGFKAVMRSVSPESYFARQAIKDNDGYSFMRSSASLGFTSVKPLKEQRATAIRTRYPQLHRRLELTGALTLIEFSIFLLPIFGTVYGAVEHKWAVLALNVICLIILSSFYGAVCHLTYGKFLIRSLFFWAIAAICDIGILNYSMWQYEFKEVIWKDRNVCLPIMWFPHNTPKR